MGDIVLAGSTSGTCTLTPAAVSGTTVLTLPTANGTIITTGNIPTGSVLQVVNATYSTATTNNTGTYVDTGLTATITPSSASNKILVLVNQADVYKATSDTSARIQLLRGSTSLIIFAAFASGTASTATNVTSPGTNYLDSPATTSAVTYKTQFLANSGAGIIVQFGSSVSTITLMEIKG